MKNPALFEVLSALHARGVAFWRIAVRPGVSLQEVKFEPPSSPVWRSRGEQLQLLWQLGWEWGHERSPVCVTEGQAIGLRLMAAVAALRQWEN